MTGSGSIMHLVKENGLVSTNGGSDCQMILRHQYINECGSTESELPQENIPPSQKHSIMPIAIIGMSCRLPGDASDPEKLWALLAQGRSAWSTVPAERFKQSSFYHPQRGTQGTVSKIPSTSSSFAENNT